MSTHQTQTESDGFARFFRKYTKTWVHAVATAGLTAFGTLTFVHRWFAVLALASYVVPPVFLYLRWRRTEGALGTIPDDAGETGETDADADARAGDEPEATSASREPGEPSEPTSEGSRSSQHDRTSRPEGAVARDRADSSSQFEHRPDREREGAEADTDDDAVTGTTESADTDIDTDTGHEDDRPARWETAASPTETSFQDVTVTETGHGYAVGTGGVVAGGRDEFDVVLEDGPAAGGNDLHGVAATDDGDAVWVAGDSGAVGRIDADTGRHTDYTAPTGITDNWLGIAVGGTTGEETVLLVDGSGAVLQGTARDGELAWADPTTPGSGSSLSGVDLADDAAGYCCDTNDGVFETTDGGDSFSRIGLEGADGTLTDLAAGDRDDSVPVLVSADDGVVHRYDGSNWTPERVTDGAATGIARRGERTVVCGDGGTIHERTAAAAAWEEADAIVGNAELGTLRAVSTGADRSVAVGDDGTIVEQRR